LGQIIGDGNFAITYQRNYTRMNHSVTVDKTGRVQRNPIVRSSATYCNWSIANC